MVWISLSLFYLDFTQFLKSVDFFFIFGKFLSIIFTNTLLVQLLTFLLELPWYKSALLLLFYRSLRLCLLISIYFLSVAQIG